MARKSSTIVTAIGSLVTVLTSMSERAEDLPQLAPGLSYTIQATDVAQAVHALESLIQATSHRWFPAAMASSNTRAIAGLTSGMGQAYDPRAG